MADMDEAQFNAWLQTHLDSVDLGDEVFVDYVANILREDSMDKEEKASSIQSFLEAAAVSVHFARSISMSSLCLPLHPPWRSSLAWPQARHLWMCALGPACPPPLDSHICLHTYIPTHPHPHPHSLTRTRVHIHTTGGERGVR